VPPSVVLVTGVSRFLGGHLAARLAADPTIDRVLGVDTVPPPRDLLRRMGRAEFVRADIRNPLIAKVISQASVDTVVHASLVANPARRRAHGDEGDERHRHDAAARRLPEGADVRRVVLKSTTAVYGSSSRDPALFDEAMTPKDCPSGGYAKDAVEIEGYLRGFARRRPTSSVTVLRFANFIGPRIDTVFTRYFALPVVPTVLGYDARVQLLHEEDALAVLDARRPRRLARHVSTSPPTACCCSRRPSGVRPDRDPGARPAVGRSAASSAARAWSTSRPSRCACSTSVGSWTPRGCARQFGFTPRWTTTAGLRRLRRGRALARSRPPVESSSAACSPPEGLR
jgi:UDP-glucose 4-epimerase